MEENIFGSPENTDSGSPTPIAGGDLGSVVIETQMSSGPPVATGDISSVSGGAGVVSGGALLGKKKRGRPRKYDADGNLSFAYSARAGGVGSPAPAMSPPPGFTLTMPSDYGSKRGRGRPPGSGNWHQLGSLGEIFANTAGGDFTPHVFTVQTGEDVAARIFSFSQKGPRGICILSANGAISNVTIRQPGSSGGLVTYEGRFEILSLTGSFTVSESSGVKSRTGGLSISLAGPDGRVVGGSVAGWLTAASPIQVVIGSFMPNGYKPQKRKYNRRSSPTAATMPAPLDSMPGEPPSSQAMPRGEAGGPPLVPMMPPQSHSDADDSIGSGHNLNVVSSHNTPEWNDGSEPSPDQRIYPDINVSVPGV